MKRLLYIVLLILPLSFTTHAQHFNGGIIAGGVASQVDGDNYGGFNKFGFLSGAFVSLQVSRHSSLQMEMEYIQKGSRIVDTITRNNELMRFHYVEIPLLYQYSFAKRFSIEAGPAMDVFVGSIEETQGIEATNTVPMRLLTLDGIFGFSGFITKHLKANMRYNYSLMSIRNVSKLDVIPGAYRKIFFEKGQYNNVISISLLWYFKPQEDL